MKITDGMFALATLRRICEELKGIREELRYSNERSFPPPGVERGKARHLVFPKRPPSHPDGEVIAYQPEDDGAA